MKFNFSRIDRRVIFVLVALSLSLPLLFGLRVKPARMDSADKAYATIEALDQKPGDFAFLALDFGPNTKAENLPQAEVIIEHLMRKRIPVALFSIYVLAEPFLESVPTGVAERLMREFPGEKWEYGKDWVNLGYNPGGFLIIQAIPKSLDLTELFQKDARGNRLVDIPALHAGKDMRSMIFAAQFTGLVGTFSTYMQFLMQRNDYKPSFVHGCTSITIPEAYIYMDSGQIKGLLEGIAGAAWYSELLNQHNPGRVPDSSELVNTGLGVAHLVVIFMVLLGNLAALLARRRVA